VFRGIKQKSKRTFPRAKKRSWKRQRTENRKLPLKAETTGSCSSYAGRRQSRQKALLKRTIGSGWTDSTIKDAETAKLSAENKRGENLQ